MAPITYDTVIPCSIPPAKFFKAFVLDFDKLVPQVVPQAIKCVELLEGDGGAGSIKLTTFGEGSQYKSVKHRIDNLDKENFTYSYTLIEGEVLNDKLESVSYHLKIEAAPDGGCNIKNRSIYHFKGDGHVTEDMIKEGKEKAKHLFKAVEDYLHANPHAYH